jgi:3-hydroxybutyryl-CoA dehydratase
MIRKMHVGDYRSYQRVITCDDIKAFGKLTGDMNLAHFDEDYCRKTIFKKPIVHGMFIGCLFSKIFGMEYPGEGTIYCGQSLKFLKPVYPGMQLTVKITVKEIILEKNRVIFTTEIFSQEGECMLTGEAVMMPRKETIDEKTNHENAVSTDDQRRHDNHDRGVPHVRNT